jgi:hypothetical protein
METPPDPSTTAHDSRSEPTTDGSRLGRIAGHTRGLVEDAREWVDLRIDLAVLKIEERVDEARNEIALGVIMAVLATFATLFVLSTIALGLGWALGHPFWGFLLVSAGLVGGSAGLYRARPDLLPPSGLYNQLRDEGADSNATDASSNADPETHSPNEPQA